MSYSIADIESFYPNWYNPNHELSYDDQKWIWENTPLSEEDELKLKNLKSNKDNTSVNLNGSVSGGSKHESNLELNLTKIDAFLLLQKCTYKTSPKLVASYLERIFSKWPSKEGHWLFIAQHYTPKTINAVILQIIKQHKRGEININNPAAYFTSVIKFHLTRKRFRSTNGGHKLKEVRNG